MTAIQLLTGAQIRMARGLLRWSVKRLAAEAGVGVSTVKKLERSNGLARDVLLPHNEAVRDALLATKIVDFEPNICVYLEANDKRRK